MLHIQTVLPCHLLGYRLLRRVDSVQMWKYSTCLIQLEQLRFVIERHDVSPEIQKPFTLF